MATVYLPFGYPVIQGAEFETVVYQGNLVRSYTLPTDPRNDSQIFQRKFLADVSKMRSYLGAFGKLAMKETLGSSWSTVLFQLIKADSFSWWSSAGAIWDGMTEPEKEAWRSAAPYQLTFNDRGWIYFCLAKVMHNALIEYRGNGYLSLDWSPSESAEAAAWWVKSKLDALILAGVQLPNADLSTSGTWILENGFYRTTVEGEGSVLAVINAREGRFHYGVAEYLGVGYLQFGNDEPIEINCHTSSGWGLAYYDYNFGRKRFLSVRFYPKSDALIGFRFLDVSGYTNTIFPQV